MNDYSDLSPVMARALEWLSVHPGSSAREVAGGIGLKTEANASWVYVVLRRASFLGLCERDCRGPRPWRWTVP